MLNVIQKEYKTWARIALLGVSEGAEILRDFLGTKISADFISENNTENREKVRISI